GPYPDMYLDRLRSFGFYEPANNQLRGEPIPKIIEPGHPEWNIATLPSMSYGYSLLVTPIQMAAFYNGLANNGKLMRPYLVKEIRNNSRIIQTYAPEVVNPEMLSQRTVDLTKETMKAVVRYGTASRQFRNVPFQVAGKTGTARKTENGRYVKKYRASFGGFFPANHPRYTLYIMVDEPDAGVASGAKVAAPIFRRIAEEVHNMDTRVAEPPVMIAQKELPKRGTFYAKNAQLVYEELGMKVGELDEVPWMRLYTDSGQTFVEHVEVEEGIIPDVRGMSARDAMNLLEGLGVKVLIRGKGRVRRQTLQPGYRMGEDVAITLYLS
ncbi:MAG: penicillin-binding transpeptidase domain-containing protein, partial [Bacteroidota bacterium]